MVVAALLEEVERSADPVAAGQVLDRLTGSRPALAARLAGDVGLRTTLVAVAAASPYLARLCLTDEEALEVLSDLEARKPSDARNADELVRWKQLELLRVAARDLTGVDDLEAVYLSLSDLADGVLSAACRLAAPEAGFTVVGMGKLGGRELNYASDIDVVFVGEGDARPVLDLVRPTWKVDVDLRPEGRSGSLIRSLSSYVAYWERWAETWEFQALLKARPVAGDMQLGAEWASSASEHVWGRPFGADDLRQMRDLKRRAERLVTRRGLDDRELKLAPGGIRDIEFAVQLLQLVHGREDQSLRCGATLPAIAALASGGYVAEDDADALAGAYRFLRTVEHRLQLYEGQQVHALPASAATRDRLARVLGFKDDAYATARARFEEQLRVHQATVRSIHERLFFRPLLEAFTSSAPAGSLAPEAVERRLTAFGFGDAGRTRQAVTELTRGFSRSSRLWQQLLPLILEWLSQSPDPDLGLLGLRQLASSPHPRDQLTAVFRESPEAARQLCLLLGTGPGFARAFERHPDLLSGFTEAHPPSPETLVRRSLSWRSGNKARQEGLLNLTRREQLRISARDVLGIDDVRRTGYALSDLADAVLAAGLEAIGCKVPLAVIAMGRFGGRELSYASDLDIMLAFDSVDGEAALAESAASALLQLLNGETPATRIYTVDTTLRPEGRDGPLARSLRAYATYYSRWAATWERQALLRGRFVAGDADVGRRFAELASSFVWERPLSEEDVRSIRRTKARVERERIPAGEDPQFHLKLGRGSLSDVEWTVQLLQLRHGVAAAGTAEAIDALMNTKSLDPADATVLLDAYRFCEQTRNRLYLVRGSPSDSLPATGPHLTALARSLARTPSELREEYRRYTRRCRRVVERLFYGEEG